MASFKTAIAAAIDAGRLPDVRDIAGRLKEFRVRIDLAAQAVVAAGENIELFDLPGGFLPHFGVLASSVTLGAATVAIGIAGTTGKYRAAAVFTTPDAPTPFGVVANLQRVVLPRERILLTVAAAALPAAGIVNVGIYGTVGD
jgi:hypothetical protein